MITIRRRRSRRRASCNRHGTLPDGTEVEYVRRRDGGYSPIPVGPDGYVPVEALVERNGRRRASSRKYDMTRVAKTVRPQQLTPEEALGWWNAPGRSDIVGIDAPDDAQVTWKRREGKAKAGKAAGTPKADPAPVPVPPSRSDRWYYPINEDMARRGQESYSWSRYQQGSATANYRRTVDRVYDLAEEAKRTARPALHEEIDSLARQFAERYGQWVDRKNSIDASNVSPMIAGPSRYDYKRRDRQTAQMERHLEEHGRIMAIPDRIAELGRPDRRVSVREPGAVESLDAQIAEAEREQETMKKANSWWRRHGTMRGCPDVPEARGRAIEMSMQQPGRMSDKPYPDYELASNRDRIKRLRTKREQIASAKEAGSSSITYGYIGVREDADQMRILVNFPCKPDEQVRSIMKRNGFRWSPTSGAWQRDLTDDGRAALQNALRQIVQIAGEEYCMTEGA